MAQALISGLLKKGISPHNITVSDCDPSKLKQLKTKFKIHTTLQN
ncbi:MAG: NAD(P)-binding domain-containing protein, partial [Deltaproteobacteria bacterium]|nr:NAD(P)-binding domain-containing protein [Deltaproteobacteria bacterium]